MKLTEILAQLKNNNFEVITNSAANNNAATNIDNIEIADIALDSRLVKKNAVFFALDGKTVKGCDFIADAVKKGAAVIIVARENIRENILAAVKKSGCKKLRPGKLRPGKLRAEKFSGDSTDSVSKLPAPQPEQPENNNQNCILLAAQNPFLLLVEFLGIFYAPLPANIYAITGTNGKTSVAEFTRQIFRFLGKKSASVGTLGIICDCVTRNYLPDSSLTTPDIVCLYKSLFQLKKAAVEDVAVEVSSIGLEQLRIAGIKIKVGSFTNFTQDHLDYHHSEEEYFRCKMLLFNNFLEESSLAILNSDIPEFSKIKKICTQRKHHILEYGFQARDIKLQKIEQIAKGQKVFFTFRQQNYYFELSFKGEFQVFNLLCALGNILATNNLNQSQLKNLLQQFYLLQPPAGRMQHVVTLLNQAQIFIDFAHSPDALKNVLQSGRKMIAGQAATENYAAPRLIVLFGCGGNRDHKKRPVMGNIACQMADLVIITDDNPRNEKPQAIRAEILTGCHGNMSKIIEISDRKQAIKKAVSLLAAGDILIIAGKGHEKYQIIGGQTFDFDEELIIKEALL
jgi:UDP-N-acetylmuramoyl-L-alanyl-D-glutamate--2,6-diaminopimelate ligase